MMLISTTRCYVNIVQKASAVFVFIYFLSGKKVLLGKLLSAKYLQVFGYFARLLYLLYVWYCKICIITFYYRVIYAFSSSILIVFNIILYMFFTLLKIEFDICVLAYVCLRCISSS